MLLKDVLASPVAAHGSNNIRQRPALKYRYGRAVVADARALNVLDLQIFCEFIVLMMGHNDFKVLTLKFDSFGLEHSFSHRAKPPLTACFGGCRTPMRQPSQRSLCGRADRPLGRCQ